VVFARSGWSILPRSRISYGGGLLGALALALSLPSWLAHVMTFALPPFFVVINSSLVRDLSMPLMLRKLGEN
jgi:hypothetical protein